jgi:hypothetical protein
VAGEVVAGTPGGFDEAVVALDDLRSVTVVEVMEQQLPVGVFVLLQL